MKPRYNFFATLLRSPSGGSEGNSAASSDSTSGSGSPSASPSSSNSDLPASSPSPSGGDGGAGISPASTPSSATSGGDFFLDRDDDDEDFDLSGVTSDDSGVREVSLPPAYQATPAVVTPPAPVTPAQQQPGQDPSSQQTPHQTQAVPASQGDEDNVQPFHANPNKFLKQLSENREAIIEALAKEKFALTDEEAIAFEENPTEALSKMGAKLYYDAMTATMARMAEIVPAMIANYQEAVKNSSKSEDFFFNKWPQLDRGKHLNEVVRIGQIYRQMNPKATSEQFVNDVGLMVTTSLGLTGKPSSPQSKPGGFRPAIGGGGSLGNGNPSLGNGQDPWSGLGMDFEE